MSDKINAIERAKAQKYKLDKYEKYPKYVSLIERMKQDMQEITNKLNNGDLCSNVKKYFSDLIESLLLNDSEYHDYLVRQHEETTKGCPLTDEDKQKLCSILSRIILYEGWAK